MARTEVTAELQRIQAANGGLLRPVDVVREASRPDSPLHNHFTWDDSEAAHQWRLQQARQLIRVTVEVLPYNEPEYMVRAYVSLVKDRVQDNGGYRAMVAVIQSPTERQLLLAQALQELNRLRVKYHQLAELDAIFRGIDRAQRNYGTTPPPDAQEHNGGNAPTPP